MIEIKREPDQQAREVYDLIVIGGGIYGLMLLLEATRRNLKTLMLEGNDFGGQTSLNHLRTVHGGLRYLQTMDLSRFLESVKERKWFLRHIPEHVKVMPCLMPLYQKGLKRVGILRIASLINDLLSFNRNRGVPKQNHLPRSRVTGAGEVKAIFPGVETRGLKGGVIWSDGSIEEYQRLFMEILKISVHNGATALNYIEATDLIIDDEKVSGIRARDRESGTTYEFKAPRVINAAGPWSRDLAKHFDRDFPRLFPKRLLNWNVLFDREALSPNSLGLTSAHGKEHTYFFHNWKNRLLVGTGELLVEAGEHECRVPEQAMDRFIRDINSTVPGMGIGNQDILRIYSGVLPAREDGRLAVRETFVDHSASGGPRGLFTISGVKYTTSRLVADKTLKKIFPEIRPIPHSDMKGFRFSNEAFFEYGQQPDHTKLKILEHIQARESVIHLSDLILRRTSLGDNPGRIDSLLKKIRPLFPWDESKWKQEINRLKAEITGN